MAAGGRPVPVIALLDSGVQGHSWLPGADASPLFVRDAAEDGWPGPDRTMSRHRLEVTDLPDYGSHAVHATFIAGLSAWKRPAHRSCLSG